MYVWKDLQGVTWAYDWTFGANRMLVQACADSGVEYMPIVVRHLFHHAGCILTVMVQSLVTVRSTNR